MGIATLEAAVEPPRVAILGDSITYQGTWTTRVEAALRSTPRFTRAEIVNFGLPSENVSGLSEDGHAGGKFPRPCLHERLARVLGQFQPTHVIACYGMNDGILLPPDPARLKAFQDGMTRLRDAVRDAGADFIAITPPLHGADQPSTDPQRYDAALDEFAAWLIDRRAEGWQVIDIRVPLREGIARAKREDPTIIFAPDQVHPGEMGHRMIADAVSAGLWEIWKLPAQPKIVEGDAIRLLRQRHDLLKHAWLSATRHLRPGIPAGKPLDQATTEAAAMLDRYLSLIAKNPA